MVLPVKVSELIKPLVDLEEQAATPIRQVINQINQQTGIALPEPPAGPASMLYSLVSNIEGEKTLTEVISQAPLPLPLPPTSQSSSKQETSEVSKKIEEQKEVSKSKESSLSKYVTV